jgi:photosystem II stability/assembly factor-like uncharacterized protein
MRIVPLSPVEYTNKTVNLQDVSAINPRDGWAVGSTVGKDHHRGGGVLLSTQDGGVTWKAQEMASVDSLNAIAFANANDGWVVGFTQRNTVVLATTDGGARWLKEYVGGPDLLTDVDCVDVDHGWVASSAVGFASGYVLATTNGGVSWNRRPVPGAGGLIAVCFADSKRGWVVGNNDVYASSDGGATWKLQYHATGTMQIGDIAFANAKDGWVVTADDVTGVSTILASTDGGVHWTAQYSRPNPGFGGLIAIDAVDARHAWAVGNNGVILATSNGGLSWKHQKSTTTAELDSVAFCDRRYGWAVGEYDDLNGNFVSGTILVTRDGGATWTRQN